MTLTELEKDIEKLQNKEKAKLLQGFFKTGKGEYGEGDIFLGIMVPQTRELSKKFSDLNFNELQKLLNTKIHEKRLLALIILVNRYKKSKNFQEKKEIYEFYLENAKKGNINNWDLVDLSCRDIVGEFCIETKNNKILYKLANSKNLWEKRIAIISTSAYIRKKEFKDTIKISEILMNDKHDLIHKAVGWMLREMGKKDKRELIQFLNQHHKNMPRTALRYSIERLNKKEKEFYMKKDVK